MARFSSLDDVMAAFLKYAPPSMAGHYTLDTMRALLALFDNPQDKLRVIHIAGTSGKTSTAYFIRGMLEASGKRTGLTVSPHIVAFNERVQIGGSPLAEDRFTAYASDFMATVAASDLKPTYFELAIALAYWVFAQEEVEYAVVETGLGGLYDGTNTVSRADKVCVITDIGLDHTEILGETLPEIAFQKAGIVQPGNQVLVCQQSKEIMTALADTIAERAGALQLIEPVGVVPASLPAFQKRNWLLAEAAAAYVLSRDGSVLAIDPEVVALQTPPGRWETYRYGDKMVILDGAHNPQKLQALSDSLQSSSLPLPAAVLANLIEAPGTKISQSAGVIASFASRLIVPEFDSGQDIKSRRSLPAAECARYAVNAGIPVIDVQPDLKRATRALLACPEQTLIVTGSLYLVSAVRTMLLDLMYNHRQPS